MYDVFISYSHKDSEIMTRISHDLDENGLQVWTDERLGLADSKSWQFLVQTAIENSGCMVAIFTPNAKQSEWVNEELSYAKAQKKERFCVLAAGDDSNAIPFGYMNKQYVDIRYDYAREINKLINSVCEYLGKVPMPKNRNRNMVGNGAPLGGDWRRTGAIFWISYDLQWTYVELMQNGSAGQINRGFRQCHHHAKRIGFKDGTVERLEKLEEEGARFPNDNDWTPQRRGEFSYEIRDIFNIVGKLCEQHEKEVTDDGFNAGKG